MPPLQVSLTVECSRACIRRRTGGDPVRSMMCCHGDASARLPSPIPIHSDDSFKPCDLAAHAITTLTDSPPLAPARGTVNAGQPCRDVYWQPGYLAQHARIGGVPGAR